MSPSLSRLLVRYVSAVQTARYIRYTQKSFNSGNRYTNDCGSQRLVINSSCSVLSVQCSAFLSVQNEASEVSSVHFPVSQFVGGTSTSRQRHVVGSPSRRQRFVRRLNHESKPLLLAQSLPRDYVYVLRHLYWIGLGIGSDCAAFAY